ncbi:hypothetical protein TTHERM_01194940 (macronuclear) [Tetrahymena thermophila SB210]|uniref:DnaJ domain protein n=1 Tax=Tetrahymena thermophila (strain SB210) TaxID=312017 RepID=Q22AI9_TETTS|nr:hypothetical protein TTHERM_01194940 [Tetrahymena thermophila SB210]EAR82327.3 hypothetical protein TTHERM_01194940 [Tetrahymena thermophila SB210]|eukprot:XP_001029990.3 hypothetical protein TTHERM_01194940 [Tetrahymena thermophila SB210]
MQRLLNHNENDANWEQKRGIYHTLGLHFNSTADEIEKNYNFLNNFYESHNENQKSIDLQKKIRLAYDQLKNIKEKEKYIHELKIRSYLCQHLEHYYMQYHELKMFPFFIFQVFHKKCKENVILEFNFVNQTITEINEGKQVQAFLFCAISSVLFGERENEFIFYLWDSGKIKPQNYKAKYTQQRDLIVQISLMAKYFYEETKPILRLQNPNFGENELRHLHSTYEHKQFTNKIYWRDRVMPPKRERKYKARRVSSLSSLFKNELVYIEIGVSQMLISKDEDFRNILHVIPLKKDYVQFITKNHQIHFCLSNEEVFKFQLEKDYDIEQFAHSLKRTMEMNPQQIKHLYDVMESDNSIKHGILVQDKSEFCLKLFDKINQCQNVIKKMTSKVEQLVQEEQSDVLDSKLWDKNQTITYSKLGNQKKQKQKNNIGIGYSMPSHYNNPYSSVSSNMN